MGNFIYVDSTTGSKLLGKDGSGIEVITVPAPKGAIKRFTKEAIWGRDGFLVGGENAYDGPDGVIEVLTRGRAARAIVLERLSPKHDNLDLYINSKEFYRSSKVISHDIEIISDKDALHTIAVAFQPFYTKPLLNLKEPKLYRGGGDVEALPVLTLVGTRGDIIYVGGYKMQMGDSTMIIDSYNRTITNHMGRSVVRDALRNADLSKYKFSNSETADQSGVKTGREMKYTGTNPAQRKEYRGSVVRTWGFPVIDPGTLIPEVSGAELKDVKVYERYIIPVDVEEWIGGR